MNIYIILSPKILLNCPNCTYQFIPALTPLLYFSADFCEVDILEEVDKSESGMERFQLEWMVKVIYILKPALNP